LHPRRGHARISRSDDAEKTEKRDIRRALLFGIIAATLEMGVVVWLLYC
jgi:hypothetical protein